MQKRALIAGAGLGGLCAAIKLQEAGYEVLLFDKNAGVGGTWYENSYPGCACDVQVALYQFSFAQSPNWTRIYPGAGEIRAYADEIADRYQLRPKLRLSEEALEANWDKNAKLWRLKTARGTYDAEVLVAALGQLNRPQWPAIEGRETFAGPKMHSARWDHSVSLKGKRVAIIGSAASAAQIIPEIAKEVAHVTVFQRTPNWVIPRYDRAITPEERALAMTEPHVAMEIAAANRRNIYLNADHFLFQAFKWTPEGRAAVERLARDHLAASVADPVLRARLTPDYPVGCKRVLVSDDFLATFNRENVSLVTEGIARIREGGVETKDGRLHKSDILVLATGFETTGWHWSMNVKGIAGENLNKLWEKAPEAYCGTTVAGFPNLFVLYGPNTNLGHTSILVMIEAQVDHMLRTLKNAEERGARALAPRPAVQSRYMAEIRRDLEKTVWSDPHCNSWYKTADGTITQNWPHSTRDYVARLADFRADDYEAVA